MSEDKYLRVKQVVERTGLSRPTIYNMMNAGTFPNKTALGERAVAWLESEIVKWMEVRKSFEKTGQEAKPGRPPTASTKKKVSSSERIKKSNNSAATSKREVQPDPLAKKVADAEDWGQNDPPPTDTEMDAIRFGLMVANQSKKPAGTPLRDRTKHVEIRPTSVSKRKIVAVISHDIFATSSSPDKKK